MSTAFAKQNSQPHKRISIRAIVKALLKANVDIGEKVFSARPNPVFVDQLPCICTYFTDETTNSQASAPVDYKRSLLLNVEVLQESAASIEDAEVLENFLDSRAFEVEHALLTSRYLGKGENVNFDWLEDVSLLATSNPTYQWGADTIIAAQKLIFSINYRTNQAEFNLCDEFLQFDTKYDISGQEAEDNINIR